MIVINFIGYPLTALADDWWVQSDSSPSYMALIVFMDFLQMEPHTP